MLLLFLAARLALPLQEPGPNAFQLLQEGRLLAALTAAEEAFAQNRGPMETDSLATIQSFVGLDERALATFESGQGALDVSEDVFEGLERRDALAAIVAASKGKRVVILNEAHHVPRHRAFSLELARALREEGFTHFAAETFVDARRTMEKGYPARATGFYTQEPMFGELVREALALGYELVNYEIEGRKAPPTDMWAGVIERETHQSQALLAVLAANPEARLFVHCGYSHATESPNPLPDGRDASWMAARLKAGGHDPLTIDQTGLGERSALELEAPAYIVADEQGLGRGSVFQREDGSFAVFGNYAGQVDMQVLLPRTQRLDGRPDWLYLRGERKGVAIPEELLAGGERRLVQAFHADEPEDAVPADQLVLEPGAPRAKLVLRPGRYRLVAWDPEGQVRRTELTLE